MRRQRQERLAKLCGEEGGEQQGQSLCRQRLDLRNEGMREEGGLAETCQHGSIGGQGTTLNPESTTNIKTRGNIGLLTEERSVDLE